jgi:hypothetical protein
MLLVLHLLIFFFKIYALNDRIRDSSIGIATGWVRFPAVHDFSHLHSVQTDSGAHPASYPRGTGGSFPGGKAAGT